MTKHHFLLALAFTASGLAAVHLGTFAWLTAFVYHNNIRGYVPAGLTGFLFFAFGWLVLQFPLTVTGRRRHRVASYFFGGFLGGPVALFVASMFSGTFIGMLGYSLQKDIAVSAIGAVLFAAGSVAIFCCYMTGRADDDSG
ncbi:MAG: hypothetical protein JNL10_14705 [Verrucomicrobiales bacterium]|nr:hypothetical protein [Verrucomicrobiales bacterium]